MKNSQYLDLGSIDHIPIGQGQCFVVQGEEIAVFRAREGKIFAVQNKCPHRGGPLSDGIIGGGKVVCPLHGHKFDLKTGQGSEQLECIKIFPMRIENGKVYLRYGSNDVSFRFKQK